jgi:hypothetical protein
LANACLYAGACVLSVLGNRRIAPSKSVISRIPGGRGEGTEVLGSGNADAPYSRMHCAILTSFAIVFEDGGEPEFGVSSTGRSRWHFDSAARKAGASGLEPVGTEKTA